MTLASRSWHVVAVDAVITFVKSWQERGFSVGSLALLPASCLRVCAQQAFFKTGCGVRTPGEGETAAATYQAP